jgi:3-hydroxy-3-methylglutaryl CoA synthase
MLFRYVKFFESRKDGSSSKLKTDARQIEKLFNSTSPLQGQYPVLQEMHQQDWRERTLPSTEISQETGDINTGSLYQNLVSSLINCRKHVSPVDIV